MSVPDPRLSQGASMREWKFRLAVGVLLEGLRKEDGFYKFVGEHGDVPVEFEGRDIRQIARLTYDTPVAGIMLGFERS
ncbi:MAG: hypothetical protein HYW25_04800 [Candidatus Aenigmarchaeota archaeon]|nr:hypothetical protein [Candidatus Aenigmarchaeota archaeon]